MKKILILISIVSFFASCDNRDAFFENQNEKPSLLIVKSGNGEEVSSQSDSLKISLKSPKKSVIYRLKASDVDANINSLTYNWIVGKGKVKQNGDTVNSINFSVPLLDIEIVPQDLGTNIVEFILTDAFGETSSVKFTLTTFINSNPVAILPSQLAHKNVESSLHYSIDASQSFDSDSKFGGEVILYKWTIEGNTFTTENKSIDYIFSNNVNKSISLQVQDNDGIWSNAVSKTYQIQ